MSTFQLSSVFKLVSLCLMLLPVLSAAQFSDVHIFGGTGNENGQQLLVDSSGSFYLSGTLDAPFVPVDEALPSYGEEDFFIGKIDGQGNWLWINSGGSFLNDEIRILRQMPNDDLLLAGTFWLELTYGDQKLQTSDNIKGIFIIRLNAQGEWQWGKVIDGADLKAVTDVKISTSGDIYLTGHFSEALQFDTLNLKASGKNDAFLLKLNPDGELLDWKQVGFKGTTRGQTIALHPDGGLFWGGVYDDTLRIDTTELYANTFDRDVFLTRYDADGNILWARRAGGVFEEELIAMSTDSSGNLLATGFLIGVMTLSDDISIQSRNGNPDIFLFKYNDLGQPQWARAIGGQLIDQPTSLCLLAEQLIIGGNYQEQIAWGGLSTPFTGGVNGFIASFDQMDGTGKWLEAVTSEDFAFVESLNLDRNDKLFVLGNFIGKANVGNLEVTSSGQYDFFLTQIAQEVTPAFNTDLSTRIKVFPNPTRDWLHISGLNSGQGQVSIYDLQGKLIKRIPKSQKLTSISLGDLSPGTYLLEVGQGWQSIKIQVVLIQ